MARDHSGASRPPVPFRRAGGYNRGIARASGRIDGGRSPRRAARARVPERAGRSFRLAVSRRSDRSPDLSSRNHRCRCWTPSRSTPPSSPTPATSRPSPSTSPRTPRPTRRCSSRPPSSPSTPTWSSRPCRTRPRSAATPHAQAEEFMDGLSVAFGREILKIVPGRVSTEVDASLSFDTEATIAKGRKLIGMYEKHGDRPQADPDQDRQHLGGHPGRREAGAGGHPLQPDAALQLRPGRRLRRGQGDADLAVRRPDLRLVQEGQGRRRDPRRPGPGRRVGDEDLQLLQEVRLQDPGHGGELPEGRADHPPGRLRPADDQPRPPGEAGPDRRAS